MTDCQNYDDSVMETTPEKFLEIERRQSERLANLTFSDKVAYIYNPLEYARETHEDYVYKYCQGPKSVVFLGMNPGPFGMAQNGVPFGEVHYVKNWLQIKGSVRKPTREHPRKLVYGLDCKRSEVSGKRFWAFLEDVSKTPKVFFSQCFVHNYCPLVFMSSTGKNITPPELQINERKALGEICDEALHEVIVLLQMKYIIGIGKFAEKQATDVIRKYHIPDIQVCGIMHPSPINPAANKGWCERVNEQLTEFGIINYLRTDVD